MLTEQEYALLELLFDLCPHWRDTITKQICKADIRRESTGSNIAIIFEVKEAQRLEFETIDPVEILIGDVDLRDCVSNMVNGCCVISANSLSIMDNNAISVLFLFRNGVIEEIEVYSLKGTSLDPITLLNKHRIYNVSNLNDIWQQ